MKTSTKVLLALLLFCFSSIVILGQDDKAKKDKGKKEMGKGKKHDHDKMKKEKHDHDKMKKDDKDKKDKEKKKDKWFEDKLNYKGHPIDGLCFFICN